MDKDIRPCALAGEFAIMLTIVLAVAKTLGIMPMTWMQAFTPILVVLSLCGMIGLVWLLVFIIALIAKKVFG